MEVARDLIDLRRALRDRSCVLVPTMGALHEGHLSLVDVGRRAADERGIQLAATIFVNPSQFNDPSDLDRYPRPLDRDLSLLRERSVDLAFVPDAETVYPPEDPAAAPQPPTPPVGTDPGLEDRFRPGHFPGVCRVISRLFDLFDPQAAVFGEKDWQQSRVVRALCEAQGRETAILIGPTVREDDGLAMSSRNTHLSPAARGRASAIWRGFEAARLETTIDGAERVIARAMASAGFDIEYAAVRDEETLMPPVSAQDRPLRMLAAGVLDGVRLLDNAPWPA